MGLDEKPERHSEIASDVDVICVAFERQLRSDEPPRIEDRLADSDPSIRSKLFSRLLSIELKHILKMQGSVPSQSDYEARFPEDLEVVSDVFNDLPTVNFNESVNALVDTVPWSNSQPTPGPGSTGPESGEVKQNFGEYQLLGVIARGGMGVVYKARQVALNRIVALKMILAGQLASESDIRRFQLEAEAAAKLDHPGIVPVYEVGEHQGQNFFSMGYVEGESLSKRVSGQPLTPRESARIMVKVSEAVGYAHEQGVIHRDLKPGNILMDSNGQPRVTDFGLAKQIEADSELTATGQVLGTPGYMPPEQACGRISDVGFAADIYALGAVLYHLLTGRPPFQAPNFVDTLRQVIDREPAPPRSLNPDIDRDLETICLKCLEKDANRRYTTAVELQEELQRFLDGLPIIARPAGALEKAWKLAKRRPLATTLSIGLVVATLVFVIAITLLNWELKKTNQLLQTSVAETEEQRDLAQSNLYTAHMKEAFTEFQQANLARVRELLQRHLPEDGQRDLRGFEWFLLWHLSHQEELVIQGHTLPIQALAFSPDGGLLVSSAARVSDSKKHPGEVVVWNSRTGKPQGYLQGHQDAVLCLAFSPDGQHLVTGSRDRTVRLWDIDSAEVLAVFSGHKAGVESLAFMKEGKHLVSADQKGGIHIWDIESRQPKPSRSFEGFNELRRIDVSPNHPLLAIANGNDVKLFDMDEETKIGELSGHTGSVVDVAFNMRGDLLASACGDHTTTYKGGAFKHFLGEVKIWRRAEQGEFENVLTLDDHQRAINCIAFSPTEEILVSGSRDQTLKIWEVGSGTLLSTLRGHTDAVNHAVFSPSGKRIASAGKDQTIRIWAVSDDSKAPSFGSSAPILSTGFSRDGRYLAVSRFQQPLSILDMTTQQLVSPEGVPASAMSVLAFSPTEDLLAVGNRRLIPGKGSHDLMLWRPGKPVVRLGSEGRGTGTIEFSPDGSQLATANQGNAICLWDVESTQLTTRLKTNFDYARDICYSPDGRLLAATDGHKVTLFSANPAKQIGELKGHTGNVSCVEFSPDGMKLVSGSVDKMAIMWDVKSRRKLFAIHGISGNVADLRFSPDGKTLVLSSGTFIRFLDPQTGDERGQVSVRSERTNAKIAFSPDGSLLVTGGWEIKFWQASKPGELKEFSAVKTVLPHLDPGGPAENAAKKK